MNTAEICHNKQRRDDVRASETLCGLDYIEVSNDQLVLTVYFLGKAPQELTPENVVISGGRRICHIKVVNVDLHHTDDPDADDYMDVTVNKAGDFSTYTLSLVQRVVDDQGRPVHRCLLGVDQCYAQVDFSFKAGCPSDLDCAIVHTCPLVPVVQPEINYLARDYATFRQLILDRLASIMPDWQERHIPDIGIVLVEVMAYTADYLSYYQDAISTEAYLSTARQRISVRRHVRLIDYYMHEGCNARAWVFVRTLSDQSLLPTDIYFIAERDRLLVGKTMLTDADVQRLPSGSYDTFEPLVENPKTPLAFYQAHNDITFYTWGETECCLPRGSTSATLLDQIAGGCERILHLQPGDFLLFEEIKGARTGVKAEADPTHRCIVRLKTVEQTTDELYRTRILAITWAIEDALPFPLCLSAIGAAPDCQLIEQISVARSNILLVDHGQSISEDLQTVPQAATVAQCEKCEHRSNDVQLLAGPFNPSLQQVPLTFSLPLSSHTPASQLIIPQPSKEQLRNARPQVRLTSIPPSSPYGAETMQRSWVPVYDLLESSGEDFHFVVEIDNDGVAHLRFGSNGLGRAPEALETFTAMYRVGNGPVGNVGAESISHIVLRNVTVDGIELVRNPLAAQGGTDSEPMDEVKLLAPGAFSLDQESAITPDDYVRLAETYPGVQRAIANFRWTGSGYDVLVAIDPLGTDQADPALIRAVERFLAPYRRIGHDVTVVQAEYVPLDISLTVCVQPNYISAHVKAALLDLFSTGIRRDGTPGFFHPDKLSFGDSIAVSALVAVAQAVTGVMSVTVDKLERLGIHSQEALQTGLLVIGPTEIAQVDNDPNYPEHGLLALKMKGGR